MLSSTVLLTLLENLLRSSRTSQQQMLQCQGFLVISHLLDRVRTTFRDGPFECSGGRVYGGGGCWKIWSVQRFFSSLMDKADFFQLKSGAWYIVFLSMNSPPPPTLEYCRKFFFQNLPPPLPPQKLNGP